MTRALYLVTLTLAAGPLFAQNGLPESLADISRSYFRDGAVLIVPSSHQDIAWMNTIEQCAADRDSLVITPALELLEKHSDYRIALESSYMLEEYLERHPERKEQIRRLTKEGRLGWGATYNQPYESSYSGESLIRGLYFGRRWLRKALPGCDTVAAWSPDVPVRSLQFQQILSKAGVKYLVISRHEQGFYRWLSPDGSGVYVWSPGHYDKQIVPLRRKPFPEAATNLAGMLAQWDDYYRQRHIPPVFPIMASADMSGPQTYYPFMAEWEKLKGSVPLPVFRHATEKEVMDRLTAGKPDLPVVLGERPNVWLYIHGPTHHHALSAAREAADLLTSAEKFSTIEALLAGSFKQYPTAAFNTAWKAQIYPDHGWGGNFGHTTDAAFRKKYEFARDEGRRMLEQAQRAIASRIATAKDKGTPIVVFNNLSWTRSDTVSIALDTKGPVRIADAQGRDVPHQFTSPAWPREINVASKTMGARATASSEFSPELGAGRVIDGNSQDGNKDEWRSAQAAGSQWVAIDFGRPRRIDRVVIRHHGAAGMFDEEAKYNTSDFEIQAADSANGPWVDLVPPVTGNTSVLTTHRFAPRAVRYLRVFITKSAVAGVEPARILEIEAYMKSPAQREVLFAAADVPSIGYKTYYAVPAEKTPAPIAPREIGTDVFENRFYRVTFGSSGISQIYDKALKQDLLDTGKFLGGELFTMQSVGNGAGEFAEVQKPTMTGFDKTSNHPANWRCMETGPVRTVFALETEMPHMTIRQTVAVYATLKRIDVNASLLGWDGTKYREIRMALPVNAANARTSYEVPFGVVEVGKDEIKGAAGERYKQPASDVRPREVQDWLSASSDSFGITMSSSVAVCDYVDPTDNPVSYPVLQPLLLASRKSCHGRGNWYLQPGDHDFRFSIVSHEPGWKNGYRFGKQSNNPLRAIVAPAREPGANLPEESSFFSIEAPNVVISTIKKWEDGDGVVIRCYEAEGRDARVRINLPVAARRADLTNIIEDPVKPLEAAGKSVTLGVGHHAIETLKLVVF
jgi:alpha-mannosidase